MKTLLLQLLFIIPLSLVAQTSATLQGNDMFYGVDAWGQLFQADGRYSMWTDNYAEDPSAFHGLTHKCKLLANGYADSGEYYEYFDTVGFLPHNASPVSSTTHLPIEWTDAYHKVWTVSGSNIAAHKADFEDNGQINDEIHEEILRYPAKGNPFFSSFYGVDAPEEALAPFFDRNDNGIYEPTFGDYPIIDEAFPEAIPNLMSFTLWNDVGLDNSLGCEFTLMTFSFSCVEHLEINKTIYTRLTIHNKSSRDYNDFVVGQRYDFDLGCPDDDYVGTDLGTNSVYVYNGDNYDNETDSTCFTLDKELSTFGNNPGVVSSTFLNSEISTSIFFRRSHTAGVYDRRPEARAASTRGIAYYLFGQDSVILDTLGHVFTDYPTITNGDNMPAQNLPSADYRILPATRIGDFEQGEQIKLYFAYSYNSSDTLDVFEEAANLANTVPVTQNFYNLGFSSDCDQQIANCDDIDCVWPGDVNNNGVVLGDDLLALQYCKINNFQGPSRDFIGQYWSGHEADTWDDDIALLNINGKHADCLGDGTVGDTDIAAYLANYRRTKSGVDEPGLLPATSQDDNLEIDVVFNRIYESSPPFRKKIASTINHILPSNHEYLGFTLSIVIDEEIFDKEEFFSRDALTTIYGFRMTSIISFPDENRKDIVFATNHQGPLPQSSSIDFFGNLTIRSDLRVPDGQDSLYIPLPVFNVKAMTMDGDYVDLGIKSDSIWLIKQNSATENIEQKTNLEIFPNPANNNVTVSCNKKANQLQILSTAGKVMLQEKIHGRTHTFPTQNLDDGLYLLKVQHQDGTEIIKRLIIQH